jgi:hypothetical protein
MRAGQEPHERTDARPRLGVILAGAIALGVAGSLLAAWGLLAAGRPRSEAPALGASGLFAHGPEEEGTGLAAAWPAIDAENREHLETYAWIDRPAGVVRIPIGQAMERLAHDPALPAPEASPP